ncbi:DUF4148 domain-containing protein [Paraburkholderia phosphatilytica]|uniref:DUF4148 domain-containing protein n=1 Tax=Paraburkholderia phosphatilytica TaxID=2282883 RepID=UPI000E4E74E2|nr:DUF4148 domain-containing protein [Paraburkholderia phosphatilytica]
MKLALKTAVCTTLLLGSASVFAASHLTPQQCNDYPFTQLRGSPTHAQLENELAELESVGYNPSAGDDADYPNDIERAEKLLRAKYRADCGVPQQSALSTAQTSN